MLEGLEVSEISYSQCAAKERFDAESQSKAETKLTKTLKRVACDDLERIANVSDGNHLSIAEDFSSTEGVRYLRGQDISSSMTLDDGNPVFIPENEYEKLSRSHIVENDVLVTIVGANTGMTALVTNPPKKLTANCKLGILRTYSSTKVSPAYLHAFLAGTYGQYQIHHSKRGGGQTGLILPDLRALKIARFSEQFETYVSDCSLKAHASKRSALKAISEAEVVFLRALGLENWQVPKPISYVRNSLGAFATGRLDAEYFQPKYAKLIELIESTGQSSPLTNLLQTNQRGKQPEYSESGLPVVNSKHVVNGEVRVDADNRYAISSESSLLIEPGDVLINGTGVGTIGRGAPYLHPSKAIPDNHVTILRPHKGSIDPVYLAVFLNSLAGQLQVEQRFRGSSGQIELYPNDIAQFTIWVAPENIQAQVRQSVEASFQAKQRATQLLDAAKRAVEIAIEDSEAAALAYLEASNP